MDRMLVVVFDNETKAYQGRSELMQLEAEGSISVYGAAVVTKNANGALTVKQEDDYGPLGSLFGTALGSIIGLLGGPAGVALGAGAGLVAGGTYDINKLAFGEDFIDDATKALMPGKMALVAEIDENWITPVDTRMEALGGTVFRRSVAEVKHTFHEQNVAAMNADLATMKAEHAQASADRKAKLHEKINKLEAKIQAQLQKAKEARDAAERQDKIKVQVLKNKAAAASAKAS